MQTSDTETLGRPQSRYLSSQVMLIPVIEDLTSNSEVLKHLRKAQFREINVLKVSVF